MAFEWVNNSDDLGFIQKVVLTGISFFITPLILKIELPKLKRVEIDETKITLTSLLTGRKKQFLTRELDGFKMSLQYAKGGPTYEIILIKNGRPIHGISSNYTKNFGEIKNKLKTQLKNLGIEEFKYFDFLIKRLKR
ncbi:intimin [Algoriphagus machipongonensis]|uniref:Intimin n=2 Tax=Algoriphagus machipongonensis TaxID=388413 RepID=A3I1H5_9BACT|nr:intimin [Algoriphagus machipongonensis]